MADYNNPDGVHPLPPLAGVPGISLPPDFALEPADPSLVPSGSDGQKPKVPLPVNTGRVRFPSRDPVTYGDAIARLVGSYSGPGFNLIFRPHSDKTHKAEEGNLNLPDDDLLELNLTHELWTFPKVKSDLGDIPNRVANPGSEGTQRKDAFLRGIPYTQLVRDVTDTSNGRGRRIPVDRLGKKVDPGDQPRVQDIHFEPGLMIQVEQSTPVSTEPTICRMASIPHGTTINAQGPKATKVDGPAAPGIPVTKSASKPFDSRGPVSFFDGNQFNFDNASATRLPQNLAPFKAEKPMEGLTPDMIDSPNALIKQHNENKKFSQVIQFTVSTVPGKPLQKQACPHLAARSAMSTAVQSIDDIAKTASAQSVKDALAAARSAVTEAMKSVSSPTATLNVSGGTVDTASVIATLPAAGTSNIAFLDGNLGPGANPNARTGKVEATFWISTVVYVVEVKQKWTPGTDPTTNAPKVLQLDPTGTEKLAKGTVPSFVFPANQPVEAGRYEVEATQVQYSQTVDLIFNGLAWPHISVATLTPVRPVLVNFAKRIS